MLPDGYRAVPSGTSQAFQESFSSLGFAFGLGLIVAYMVLAAQFNAFSHPFTVLLALPFSISGRPHGAVRCPGRASTSTACSA